MPPIGLSIPWGVGKVKFYFENFLVREVLREKGSYFFVGKSLLVGTCLWLYSTYPIGLPTPLAHQKRIGVPRHHCPRPASAGPWDILADHTRGDHVIWAHVWHVIV